MSTQATLFTSPPSMLIENPLNIIIAKHYRHSMLLTTFHKKHGPKDKARSWKRPVPLGAHYHGIAFSSWKISTGKASTCKGL